jgi:magnesium-dependent phosphatase 1
MGIDLHTLLIYILFVSTLIIDISVLAMTPRTPKLVAFDLDGTVWTPDMYMLWGGGAPFTVNDPKKSLVDKVGAEVRLLGAVSQILDDLHTKEEWQDTVTSWVSCTDEPSWAQECLQKFQTSSGVPFKDVVEPKAEMIFKSNKKDHFKKLKANFPHLDYSDMIFFDNESGNIRSVSTLGVLSVYCPDGMTQEIWESGLVKFAAAHNS